MAEAVRKLRVETPARRDAAPPRDRVRAEKPAPEDLAPAARGETAPSGETVARTTGTPAAGRPRGRWLRPVLFGLLPIALVAFAYLYVVGGSLMSTDNAYVRADMVGVSTDVSGIVKTVEVGDNQKVAVGDVLFRLDDTPFRLALERADAQGGIVRDDINALKATYRDMEAQIAQQQVDIDFYARDFERQQQLAGRGFAPQATYDQSQRALQGARQKLLSLKQQLAVALANLSGDPDIRAEDHPRYKQALAQRDEAARQLDHTVVRAPLAGIVTNVPSLQPGMYLTAATASVSVVATDHVWVEANPKETELTYVRPGQVADVTVDTYPGELWKGIVESISPASGSSFSLLPAQNTSGNWVKVVQRIPLRVRIETPEGRPPLRAGMSVEVDVETGHARGLPAFLTDLFGGRRGPAAAGTAGGGKTASR